MQRAHCKILWLNPSPSHDRRLIVSWSLSQPKLTCHPLQDSMHRVGEHVILDTHQYGFSCPISSLSNTSLFFHSLISASLSIFRLLTCFQSPSVKLSSPIRPFLWVIFRSRLLPTLPCHRELCSHMALAWLPHSCWIIALIPLLSVCFPPSSASSQSLAADPRKSCCISLLAYVIPTYLYVILCNVFAAVATLKTISLPVRLCVEMNHVKPTVLTPNERQCVCNYHEGIH